MNYDTQTTTDLQLLIPAPAANYLYDGWHKFAEVRFPDWWHWYDAPVPPGVWYTYVWDRDRPLSFEDAEFKVRYQCDRLASGLYGSFARISSGPDPEDTVWYVAMRSGELIADADIGQL